MGRTNDAALANWPRAWALASDDAALEGASSAAIFKRGRAHADSGCVQVVAEDPPPEPALRARVTGTELYTTDVWIEGGGPVGECDCPNAQDGWFCKHQVAAALVYGIAIHLPDERQDHAVELPLRVFEAAIQRSSSPYREALALVGEIGQRMDAVRRQDGLTQLRAQYKLKRNFVRDLPRQ